MENKTLVNKYELMLILESRLSNEEKEAIYKEAVDTVGKGGGKVINSQVFLDKHKMAFRIKRCAEGTYYLINFEAEGQAVHAIQSILNLNEKILRFAISRVVPQIILKAAKS